MSSVIMILVNNGIVFKDNFTVINPQSTGLERASRMLCSWVWGCRGWIGLWIGCYNDLGQLGLRERHTERLADLIILSQSLTMLDIWILCTRKYIRSSMTCMRTHRHAHNYPGERKRSYNSPEPRGQRLPLQMTHSHVQPFNRDTNHTFTYTYTVTLNLSRPLLHDHPAHRLQLSHGPHFLSI